MNGLDWQCYLAGSSKMASRIFIFSIVLVAEYLSYVKSIATYALTFIGYIISVLDSVFTLFLMKSYWVKSIACVPSCGRSFCKLIYKKLLTLTKTCGSFRKNYDQNATSMHILSQFKVWMTLMPLNEFRVSQWSPKSFWSWS